MQGLYFYAAAIGFVFGIFIQTLWPVGLVGVTGLAGLALVVGVVSRREREAFSAAYVLAFAIFLFTTSLGLLRVEYTALDQPSAALSTQVNQSVTLEGVVSREPEWRENTTHLYVRVAEETILAYAERSLALQYGDRVEIVGELSRPEAFETDLGRTFDYAGYLAARDVHFVVFRPEVTVLESEAGNPLLEQLFTFKSAFLAQVNAFIMEPAAGLGAGLLLGVKGALGESLEEVFRRTGIIHIVVLSGYNVMIVAEAIMRSLALVFVPRTRLIFGVVAITLFAILVGLGATVVRASIMAILVLIARATGRTYAILRALTFAGIVMLCINPLLLVYDPGFQLSFLASLGLILVAPHIEALFHFTPTRFQVREFLVATISTQIFVLPLLLYSIGEFSVVAVLVNVLVLPVVPLAMALVFVVGLSGFVWPLLASVLAVGAQLILSYIILTAEWFATLPFASYVVPAFPFWVVVVSYAVMAYGLWWLEARKETAAGVRSTPPPVSGLRTIR